MNLFDVLFAKKLAGGGDYPAIIKRVTGTPVEFTDGASAPLIECVSAITGYQSGTGTPSPDNIRPIVAYTEGKIVVRGRNLFDKNDPDTINGYFNASNTSIVESANAKTIYIPCKPNTTYTIGKNAGTRFSVGYTDALPNVGSLVNGIVTSNTASSITITTGVNAVYLVSFVYNASSDTGTAQDMYDSIIISESATPIPYEPYKSTTHTTTFPSAIYRGSEDAVNGTVTPELVKVVFDGSNDENWQKYTSGSAAAFAMRIPLSDVKASTVNMISSYLQTIPISATWGNFDNWISTDGDGGELITGMQSITTVEDWKTYLANNPLEVVYEVKTPTTTPVEVSNLPVKSLSGYNHIESSTGDLDMTYITEGYQEFVNEIESTYGRRKGGKKPIDVFRMLEGDSDPKEEEEEKEEKKEENKK